MISLITKVAKIANSFDGTGFTVTRMQLLGDKSGWQISVQCDEDPCTSIEVILRHKKTTFFCYESYSGTASKEVVWQDIAYSIATFKSWFFESFKEEVSA